MKTAVHLSAMKTLCPPAFDDLTAAVQKGGAFDYIIYVRPPPVEENVLYVTILTGRHLCCFLPVLAKTADSLPSQEDLDKALSFAIAQVISDSPNRLKDAKLVAEDIAEVVRETVKGVQMQPTAVLLGTVVISGKPLARHEPSVN